MLVSSNSVKRHSRGLWLAVLSAVGGLATVSLASGCVVEDRYDDGGVTTVSPPDETPPAQTPMAVTIDTDQTMTAGPGDGTGLFVEYAAGGHWKIWLTCDTNKTGQACPFDVTASTLDQSTRISNLQ